MTLEARALRLARGDRVLCRGLDARFDPGQCWCILGRNGSGKTTLLHTLAGLFLPQAGEVLLHGQPLARQPRRQLARELGLLPQDHWDPFPATVLETALLGRHPHLGPWHWEGETDRALARAALARVGLTELAGREVGTLSGGERRRLGFATLLTQDPVYLLLDEPTNHLDLHHQLSLLGHLQSLSRSEGKCLIMVLHDPNLAARFADHAVLLLEDGSACAGPTAATLHTARLEALYGHSLRQLEVDGRPLWVPR